ncbi:hypothetical protein ACFV83_36750, partial [Streptomyces pharetrae]
MSITPRTPTATEASSRVRADAPDPEPVPGATKTCLGGDYANGDERLVEVSLPARQRCLRCHRARKARRGEGVRAAEDGRGDAGIETGSVKAVAPPGTGTDLACEWPCGHSARFGLVRADHAVQARIPPNAAPCGCGTPPA